MKPIKAWAVLSDEQKPATCQTVFCPTAFAWGCFETRRQAVAFGKLARKKRLMDFPTIVRVVITPVENRKAIDIPLDDIRELLDD